MKVLLINPPFERLQGKRSIYFPLGLAYMSAVVRGLNIGVKIYNAELLRKNDRTIICNGSYAALLKAHHFYTESLQDDNHPVWKEIRETIFDFQPEVIGIGVKTSQCGSAAKISRIAKELNEDCFIVWGGPHPTLQPEETLKENNIDFVIEGEGEQTFVELLLSIQDKNLDKKTIDSIPGLSYKINGQVFRNNPRQLLVDLNQLPFPSREFEILDGMTSTYDIITSRGCPFKCGYCSAWVTWKRKVRYRSIDNVLKEIKDIISMYKIRTFNFWDDTFTLNYGRTVELCERFIKERLKIKWGCTTRVDLLDDELLKIMKEAGCDQISIGVESGSQDILNDIDKGITVEQVQECARLIKKNGIRCEAFFMAGFPNETSEDLRKTFDLMKRLDVGICFSTFTPYPGTPQFEIARKYNLIPTNPDWSQFSHQSPENHFVKAINKEEFRRDILEIAHWIDKKNISHLKLGRLLVRNLLDLPFLLTKPRLFFRKICTGAAAFKKKIISFVKTRVRTCLF